jgi:hypothetical protein
MAPTPAPDRLLLTRSNKKPVTLYRVEDVNDKPSYNLSLWYTFFYDTEIDSYICANRRNKPPFVHGFMKSKPGPQICGAWTRGNPRTREPLAFVIDSKGIGLNEFMIESAK